MLTRIVRFPALLALLVLLAACGAPAVSAPDPSSNGSDAPPSAAAASDSSSAAASASYPVTIENCGNTLQFDRAPERVVTLYPPTTEMMLRLGLGDRIIGAAATKDGNIAPDLQAEYQSLTSISETAEIPKEVLLSQEADFIFDNQPDWFYSAENGFATQDELRAAGAQIYSLSTNCGPPKPGPRVEDIYTDIRNLGAIFNVRDRAEQVVAEMEARITAAQQRIADQPRLKVLVYDAGEGPLNVFGANSSRFAVFKALGAESVFPELPDGYGPVSAEEIASRDADVFVVLGYTYPGVATPDERVAFLKQTFPNSTAVKNDRVVVLPYEYMNPSVQNAVGVEELAKLLYPEAFQ
jgi:iron complex transport system substrate-binding protein